MLRVNTLASIWNKYIFGSNLTVFRLQGCYLLAKNKVQDSGMMAGVLGVVFIVLELGSATIALILRMDRSSQA